MAIGVVVVGAMVTVWAGIAFEEKLVEQWYLWKLDSAEEKEQELAAEKLGQMRSIRAVPRLVEILRRTPKHAVQSVAFSPDGTRLSTTVRIWDVTTGKPITFSGSTVRVWDTATWKPISGDIRSHYSFKALVRIGQPAVSALRRLLEDKDDGTRWAAALALNEIDPQGHAADSCLRGTLIFNSVKRTLPSP